MRDKILTDIKITDIQYEDGCYSGLVIIIEKDKEAGIHICISFLYDVELNLITVVNRLYPNFNAPIIHELPDYIIENYDYIMHLIKEECNYR